MEMGDEVETGGKHVGNWEIMTWWQKKRLEV
jgi:hypothetical protein